MGKADRILADMAANPGGGWRIDQVQTVAKAHGITWRQGKGSHLVLVRPDGGRLTVPVHGRIHPVYIRQFVRLVEGG